MVIEFAQAATEIGIEDEAPMRAAMAADDLALDPDFIQMELLKSPDGPKRTRTPRRSAAPHERSVLPNGLRVVSQAMPHARSVSVALFVGVGSRHEAATEAGLSHMVEHLVFKGTRGYPEPGALSEAIEACGGTVNASTDRELTVYSARVPRSRADRAFEVVAELALRPLLRPADLVAEKPVVVDEIRAYVDSPSDHVFALFDQLLFGDHPLGREIAGTPQSVRRTTHADVERHWQRWYVPQHMVLAVAGAIDHAAVRRAARGWFDRSTPAHKPVRSDGIGAAPAPGPSPAGAVQVAFRRLSQGNLCLGMPGVSRTHPDRWALDLLTAVLGDGMSSRLFVELRERRSLAYDIGTFAASYADCGTVGIHAGFDPDPGVGHHHGRPRAAGAGCPGTDSGRGAGSGPRLHPRPDRAAPGRVQCGGRLAGDGGEPAPADPDRGRGGRAPGGGDRQ